MPLPKVEEKSPSIMLAVVAEFALVFWLAKSPLLPPLASV